MGTVAQQLGRAAAASPMSCSVARAPAWPRAPWSSIPTTTGRRVALCPPVSIRPGTEQMTAFQSAPGPMRSPEPAADQFSRRRSSARRANAAIRRAVRWRSRSASSAASWPARPARRARSPAAAHRRRAGQRHDPEVRTLPHAGHAHRAQPSIPTSPRSTTLIEPAGSRPATRLPASCRLRRRAGARGSRGWILGGSCSCRRISSR